MSACILRRSSEPIHLIAIAALSIAAACTESEQSCYDRISADLEQTAEGASKSGHHERAIKALESALSARVIFLDDDRSICDYVTADVYLQRK